MTVTEPLVILDASVVVAWFLTDEPSRVTALALGEAVRDKPRNYVVPPFFHSELVHVLARRSAKDARFVKSAIGLVLRLGLRTVSLSESALLRTGHWACRGLSGYDATYVALAEDLGGRWLTSDERAAKKAGPKFARTLADWARKGRA
ncbi:MAG: type II toxin-antitoxin system VapC family toxin [Deltaproteobacteria bacterium]|nr:type II toxin-antitoxin system VapC family toxin [Deltaproteobacteria bacterium]